jgi:hypothetical protein
MASDVPIMLINFYGGSMDKDTSIDSNGYYMGDDLTPEQEQHNLDLDKQIGGNDEQL